jgi:hypothetical protein
MLVIGITKDKTISQQTGMSHSKKDLCKKAKQSPLQAWKIPEGS